MCTQRCCCFANWCEVVQVSHCFRQKRRNTFSICTSPPQYIVLCKSASIHCSIQPFLCTSMQPPLQTCTSPLSFLLSSDFSPFPRSFDSIFCTSLDIVSPLAFLSFSAFSGLLFAFFLVNNDKSCNSRIVHCLRQCFHNFIIYDGDDDVDWGEGRAGSWELSRMNGPPCLVDAVLHAPTVPSTKWKGSTESKTLAKMCLRLVDNLECARCLRWRLIWLCAVRRLYYSWTVC